MVVVPDEPPHVVVDDDWIALIVITGNPGIPTVVSSSDALATDLPGNDVVLTFAHNACPDTSPPSVATHGTDVDEVDVVEIAPVSGTGPSVSSGAPSRVACAA